MYRNPLETVGRLDLDFDEDEEDDSPPVRARTARRRRKRHYRWDSRRRWCHRVCVGRDSCGRWKSLKRRSKNPPYLLERLKSANPERQSWQDFAPWLLGGAAALYLIHKHRTMHP